MPIFSVIDRKSAVNLVRLVMPFAVAALCVWAVLQRMGDVPVDTVLQSIRSVPVLNWVLALVATWVSFWALGRYDALAHRFFATGITPGSARLAGQAAIGFSQLVGFGLISGAFARWRLIPGLSPISAFRITLFVSISFMAALGVIAAVFWIAATSLALAALVALAVTAGVAALVMFKPVIDLRWRRICLPTLPVMAAVTLWSLVDVVAAGTAFYFVLPQDMAVPYGTLIQVYVLALGLSLVSGAPGGVGAFELAVVSLLAGQDTAALAAGILAFRLVYYAVPGALAGIALMWPRRSSHTDPTPLPRLPYRRHRFARAETGVVRQPGGAMLASRATALAIVETGQTLTCLFDPAGPRHGAAFDMLQTAAEPGQKVPCFYKCSGRMAVLARRHGWRTIRVAADAVLAPAAFTLKGAKRRQLRRKLRHAETGGVSVSRMDGDWDWTALERIDRAWQAQHGQARGVSMGRYDPGYLSDQVVLAARCNGEVVAFVSLHHTPREWTLDLMRAYPDCPDGTMHMLVTQAIEEAARIGIREIRLAACPDHPLTRHMGRGLHQFKRCFAPDWRPLYMAAPSWGGLALAALDLTSAIRCGLPPAAEPEHGSSPS